MSKKTAVEWLFEQIYGDKNHIGSYTTDGKDAFTAFEQAKAMEREQIVEAWNSGDYAYFYSKETGREFEDGSEYYNETYKGGKQ